MDHGSGLSSPAPQRTGRLANKLLAHTRQPDRAIRTSHPLSGHYRQHLTTTGTSDDPGVEAASGSIDCGSRGSRQPLRARAVSRYHRDQSANLPPCFPTRGDPSSAHSRFEGAGNPASASPRENSRRLTKHADNDMMPAGESIYGF